MLYFINCSAFKVYLPLYCTKYISFFVASNRLINNNTKAAIFICLQSIYKTIEISGLCLPIDQSLLSGRERHRFLTLHYFVYLKGRIIFFLNTKYFGAVYFIISV